LRNTFHGCFLPCDSSQLAAVVPAGVRRAAMRCSCASSPRVARAPGGGPIRWIAQFEKASSVAAGCASSHRRAAECARASASLSGVSTAASSVSEYSGGTAEPWNGSSLLEDGRPTANAAAAAPTTMIAATIRSLMSRPELRGLEVPANDATDVIRGVLHESQARADQVLRERNRPHAEFAQDLFDASLAISDAMKPSKFRDSDKETGFETPIQARTTGKNPGTEGVA